MRKLILAIVFIFAFGLTVSSIMVSAQEDYNIPAWIKNNAAWWSEGQIDDASFVSGIKYMIENGIMEINTGDLSIADEYEDRGDFYITYKPNPNSRYTGDDTAIAWLKNVELLEAEVEFLNENFRLPYDVEVVAQECDEINAWYDWEKKQLVMCYEFIDDVFEGYYYFYGEDEDFDEQVWADYGYNVGDYVFWHEVGHAFIDIYELPITGLEEDVADQFAALMLSYTYDSETGSYTLGQTMLYDVGTWYYNENLYWSEIYPAETGEEYVPLYWDVHSLDIQRFYNITCYAYGSDPEYNQHLVNTEDLPEDRAIDCEYEYFMIEYGWEYLLGGVDNGFFD